MVLFETVMDFLCLAPCWRLFIWHWLAAWFSCFFFFTFSPRPRLLHACQLTAVLSSITRMSRIDYGANQCLQKHRHGVSTSAWIDSVVGTCFEVSHISFSLLQLFLLHRNLNFCFVDFKTVISLHIWFVEIFRCWMLNWLQQIFALGALNLHFDKISPVFETSGLIPERVCENL